jgi:hypothetical protein
MSSNLLGNLILNTFLKTIKKQENIAQESWNGAGEDRDLMSPKGDLLRLATTGTPAEVDSTNRAEQGTRN